MFKVTYLVAHIMPNGHKITHHGETLAMFTYLADAREYVKTHIGNAIDSAYRMHGYRVELVDWLNYAIETTYGEDGIVTRSEYTIGAE